VGSSRRTKATTPPRPTENEAPGHAQEDRVVRDADVVGCGARDAEGAEANAGPEAGGGLVAPLAEHEGAAHDLGIEGHEAQLDTIAG